MEKTLNILIIDDSLTVSRYLHHVLTQMGHHVSTANDGTTGLRLYEKMPFDLILLDLMLPDLDGISILKQVRARDQNTCIVMVTGHGDIRTAIEAVRQGADGYVEKSQITIGGDLDEFLHVIQRAIEIRDAHVSRLRLEQEVRQKNRELEATVQQLQQARNALLDERNKLQEILFSLSELVIVVDRDGRIILMNPLAEKELGISQEEAIGRALAESDVHHRIWESAQDVVRTGDILRTELPHLRTKQDGTGRSFSATLNPVRLHSGELLGVVIILRDITQEKELEQMKADFYSMITHDLRSPATAITGFVEILAQETIGPLNSAQKEIISIIQRSVQKLLNLVNDFLDYSAIDAGFLRLECTETDLDQVVREAVREAQPLANQRRHMLNMHLPAEPVLTWADGERMNQVVTNLLTNAIKYTPEGGHISVALQSTPDSFIIEVSDNGIGIPADQIPLLFSKYKRVSDGRTRNIQGTGLGLLIVKEIVKAHGGEITVESEPGRGSTFHVTLPRKRPDNSTPQYQPVATDGELHQSS